MAAAVEHATVTASPKRRKVNERKSEQLKKQRVMNHQTGDDCKCIRFKCFEVTSEADREDLVSRFNRLPNKDEQDAFLSRLVTVQPIARRRQREESATHLPNDHSYSYHVPVVRDGSPTDIKVCSRGFHAMFGITRSRMETIKKSLVTTGFPPKDRRGKHTNRPHQLSPNVKKLIHDHILSFRGRLSHYCRDKTRKPYLPEDLNISKMFALFKEQHSGVKISYETYRTIFHGMSESNVFPQTGTQTKSVALTEEEGRLLGASKRVQGWKSPAVQLVKTDSVSTKPVYAALELPAPAPEGATGETPRQPALEPSGPACSASCSQQPGLPVCIPYTPYPVMLFGPEDIKHLCPPGQLKPEPGVKEEEEESQYWGQPNLTVGVGEVGVSPVEMKREPAEDGACQYSEERERNQTSESLVSLPVEVKTEPVENDFFYCFEEGKANPTSQESTVHPVDGEMECGEAPQYLEERKADQSSEAFSAFLVEVKVEPQDEEAFQHLRVLRVHRLSEEFAVPTDEVKTEPDRDYLENSVQVKIEPIDNEIP